MAKLNDEQLKQLAEFTSNASILFLGTSVGPVLTPIGRADPFMVILGLVLTVASLSISMLLLKGYKGK